jgi:hypothetical protein
LSDSHKVDPNNGNCEEYPAARERNVIDISKITVQDGQDTATKGTLTNLGCQNSEKYQVENNAKELKSLYEYGPCFLKVLG